MKINKIILYNFNSFEGENEIDFSVQDDSRNIVLIGGKNGAGKTSLFTAIKIALYGPLAFGYQGVNPHYVVKIRDCINSRAFQTNKVEARVTLNLALLINGKIENYELCREWDYSGKKLVENFSVKNGGELLDAHGLSYFQNYLQGIIPPDLFEFFLFDGEEVGSIFSTSSYNNYVRNAIYRMCGLDTYEHIRKYTRGYAGKASSAEEERLIAEYEELKQQVEVTEDCQEHLVAEIADLKEQLAQVETQQVELETAFKKAGGITTAEKEKMARDAEHAERIKVETSTKVKLFMEGLMPFYIVRDFTGKVTEQLEYEGEGAIYNYIQQRLLSEELKTALLKTAPVSSVDKLMNILLEKFKPHGFNEDAVPMHDLSKDETARVNAVISSLDNFDAKDMVNTVKQKKAASDLTVEINKRYKSAITDEDAELFHEREKQLLTQKSALELELQKKISELEGTREQLMQVTTLRDRAWQRVKDNARNQHVFELSGGLASMMESLLKKKTDQIKERLEKLIVDNLHHIYRKNNLITHIEIDDGFQFNLYQNAAYTAGELAYLMRNIGRQEFALMLGSTGLQILFAYYGVDSLGQLQRKLAFHSADKFELYKNIDLSRLSKGERQIFILSLYWAIIELSEQDIPFVIDTPYARIDTSHRTEISEKFFPNISKQVVILSTDEEINEDYYRIIKPYVAREYLLVNDEGQNKTTVEQRYFFEVTE